ncbi:MAG: hypothetical protein ACWA5R_12115 [bacterium]
MNLSCYRILLLCLTLISQIAIAGSALYAVSPYSGNSSVSGGLMDIDPATGIVNSAIDITFNGSLIDGANGLAIDPTTGVAFIVIKSSAGPQAQRGNKRFYAW